MHQKHSTTSPLQGTPPRIHHLPPARRSFFLDQSPKAREVSLRDASLLCAVAGFVKNAASEGEIHLGNYYAHWIPLIDVLEFCGCALYLSPPNIERLCTVIIYK